AGLGARGPDGAADLGHPDPARHPRRPADRAAALPALGAVRARGRVQPDRPRLPRGRRRDRAGEGIGHVGICKLGYVGLDVSDLDAWTDLLGRTLGVGIAREKAGADEVALAELD